MREPARTVEAPKRRRTHEELVAESMKDPLFIAAHEEMEQELAFFDECLKARKKAGLTQEDVARRMGTSTSAVGRMETAGSRYGKPSPSVATLQKYAAALGCKLVLRLEALQKSPKDIESDKREAPAERAGS